jgi:hypothetical protein
VKGLQILLIGKSGVGLREPDYPNIGLNITPLPGVQPSALIQLCKVERPGMQTDDPWKLLLPPSTAFFSRQIHQSGYIRSSNSLSAHS